MTAYCGRIGARRPRPMVLDRARLGARMPPPRAAPEKSDSNCKPGPRGFHPELPRARCDRRRRRCRWGRTASPFCGPGRLRSVGGHLARAPPRARSRPRIRRSRTARDEPGLYSPQPPRPRGHRCRDPRRRPGSARKAPRGDGAALRGPPGSRGLCAAAEAARGCLSDLLWNLRKTRLSVGKSGFSVERRTRSAICARRDGTWRWGRWRNHPSSLSEPGRLSLPSGEVRGVPGRIRRGRCPTPIRWNEVFAPTLSRSGWRSAGPTAASAARPVRGRRGRGVDETWTMQCGIALAPFSTWYM